MENPNLVTHLASLFAMRQEGMARFAAESVSWMMQNIYHTGVCPNQKELTEDILLQ